MPGDQPFTGDFNGDGIDTFGMYRLRNGLVYYRNLNSTGPAQHQFFFGLPGDLVLVAIGQNPLGELVRDLDGVALDRGKIQVDEKGATGRPGVFAGGDCVNGGKEVVNAVAEGHAAALGIDAYLKRGAK